MLPLEKRNFTPYKSMLELYFSIGNCATKSNPEALWGAFYHSSRSFLSPRPAPLQIFWRGFRGEVNTENFAYPDAYGGANLSEMHPALLGGISQR
jgi:hypothetical protein